MLDGKDLDEAVQAGRWKIFDPKRGADHFFGAPVLFSYAPQAIYQPSNVSEKKTQSGVGVSLPGVASKGVVTSADNPKFHIERAQNWLGTWQDSSTESEKSNALTQLKKWVSSAIDAVPKDRRIIIGILKDALACLEGNSCTDVAKMLEDAHIALELSEKAELPKGLGIEVPKAISKPDIQQTKPAQSQI